MKRGYERLRTFLDEVFFKGNKNNTFMLDEVDFFRSAGKLKRQKEGKKITCWANEDIRIDLKKNFCLFSPLPHPTPTPFYLN